MSDDTSAMLAALQAQMAALAAQAAPGAMAAPAQAWGVPAPAPQVQIVGVSIPIKYQTPMGSVKVLLTLPADCASSPAALDVAMQNIMALGFELDAWKPKDQGGGWGGYNRGGNTSGGWRR